MSKGRAISTDRATSTSRADALSGAARKPRTRGEFTRRATKVAEPILPDEVTAADLDRSIRRELSGLSTLSAERVARHLVMAARHLEDEPERAYLHAMAAADRAGRVGVVREAAGLAAYAAGRYETALAELRAAKRITGDVSYWPVMADCERGLGRPERALSMAGAPEASRLDLPGQVEMRIVASGARRDLGQPEAAVLTLQGPQLSSTTDAPWRLRLWYAYADALLEAGRLEESQLWFSRLVGADHEGETDAADRLARLQGTTFVESESE